MITDLQNEMRTKCEAETTEATCSALGVGSRVAPCIWTPEPDPGTCTLNSIDSSIDEWLRWTMIALFGLAFGQLIRLLSSHIFRKATKDQVDIADFEDPFLATDSYDRWSKYSASYRDPDRGAASTGTRDRWGN